MSDKLFHFMRVVRERSLSRITELVQLYNRIRGYIARLKLKYALFRRFQYILVPGQIVDAQANRSYTDCKHVLSVEIIPMQTLYLHFGMYSFNNICVTS